MILARQRRLYDPFLSLIFEVLEVRIRYVLDARTVQVWHRAPIRRTLEGLHERVHGIHGLDHISRAADSTRKKPTKLCGSEARYVAFERIRVGVAFVVDDHGGFWSRYEVQLL